MMRLGPILGSQRAAIAALALLSFSFPAQSQTPQTAFEGAFGEIERPPLPLEAEEHAVDLNTVVPPAYNGSDVLRSLGGGVASFYGRRFHGRLTASGETFDMYAFTAAHRSLPFGSLVRVTNPANGLSVVVRINDRGPFVSERVIDLSRAAAEEIGLIHRGHAEVELELLES